MSLNIPNLDRLISYLEALPPEEFNMAFADPVKHECHTCCCIGGHIGILTNATYHGAFGFLGDVSLVNYSKIFTPDGWYNEDGHNRRYPLSRALRMLRHLRAEFVRTGTVVVDWDASEGVETPRKAWAPPVVIGADKPLPAELTRLVREPASSLITEV